MSNVTKPLYLDATYLGKDDVIANSLADLGVIASKQCQCVNAGVVCRRFFNDHYGSGFSSNSIITREWTRTELHCASCKTLYCYRVAGGVPNPRP